MAVVKGGWTSRKRYDDNAIHVIHTIHVVLLSMWYMLSCEACSTQETFL